MINTTYTDNGDDTVTVAIEITKDQDKINLLSPEASKYIYEHNPDYWIYDEYDELIGWDDLTNQQKLQLLGKEVAHHLKSLAFKEYHDSAVLDTTSTLDSPDNRYGNEE